VTAGVIDASIAMTWCFEDEAARDTDRLFERVRDDSAGVAMRQSPAGEPHRRAVVMR
jgi:hypothetical protein